MHGCTSFRRSARSRTIEEIVIGDWAVQGLCPHLKANLERFGKLDGAVLTCQLHGWKFDLPTGRCVTSAGHPIRARRVSESPQEG